ncbi:hypothetical protein MES5069_1320004 [Mesorhizobium escarrei]|uniref:ABC transmembrane type-1 domain-containing protein n=2 Tax=Mesorhizobium escarrei TaxID=666018 RepID=A0ABN8JGK7_9HYPH|nr:hypothetical protein MES5069_1320004 [Mesorhizobium escarrei]
MLDHWGFAEKIAFQPQLAVLALSHWGRLDPVPLPPPAIREAAQAYGATRWFLLTRVDLPLAMPSIMAGINQTILMCLSMVVIASLIGANGLGEDVLNALQYAAVGQGLLAGFAILLCAMIIDRIVQGRSK